MTRVAHVRCGSDIRDSLRASGVLGREDIFLETHDPVCEGPLVAGGWGATPARARWIANAWSLDVATCVSRMEAHRGLADVVAGYDEICLWFEHDLYDQASLVELLARWQESSARDGWRSRLRLVTTDRHPSVSRFIGLGQLAPDALPALYRDRRPIAEEDFALASQTWRGMTSADPRSLQVVQPTSAFPYLPAAISRHLAELPGVVDGVGATERALLRSLQAGPRLAIECFQEYLQTDVAPWLGDLMYWARLRGLAEGVAPLIVMEGVFPAEQLSLTTLGEAVARGEADWLRFAAPAEFEARRHRGGVEIVPSQAHWRCGRDGAPVCVPAVRPASGPLDH